MREGEETLPPDRFLESVKFLNAFLTARNVETWMWGDMLIGHSEAPNMVDKNFHGDKLPGYGSSIRSDVPKDILIFDWHSHDEGPDFSSISIFKNEGFDVVGVTYKKEINIVEFSKSAAQNGALGMMSTNWDFSQTNDLVELKSRLTLCGNVFSEHFSDTNK